MILLTLILLTNINTVNQPFIYPHIPPFGPTAPVQPVLNPNDILLMLPSVEHRNWTTLIATNGDCPDVDCNYIDSNGVCVIQPCPGAPTGWNLSCNPDPSEPSQLEVWWSPVMTNFLVSVVVTNIAYGAAPMTNQISPWRLYALVNGNNCWVPDVGSNGFFMVRSTVPGYITPWNTQ